MAFAEISEGINIIQPRVARNELPWVLATMFTTPKRVAFMRGGE
jgi:hypothetical protein